MNFTIEYRYEDGRFYLFTGSGEYQTYNSDWRTIEQAHAQAQRISRSAGFGVASIDLSLLEAV